jgi:hypothetical protein
MLREIIQALKAVPLLRSYHTTVQVRYRLDQTLPPLHYGDAAEIEGTIWGASINLIGVYFVILTLSHLHHIPYSSYDMSQPLGQVRSCIFTAVASRTREPSQKLLALVSRFQVESSVSGEIMVLTSGEADFQMVGESSSHV